nr:LuxR C-terminal-related transcriptional regulator [uncultured Aminipila sp.]
MTEKDTILELPPTMVLRSRLQNIFEDNFKLKRIIYVSAYTGWGKTTAVAEWLNQKKHEAVWFCLGEQRNQTVINKLLTEINSRPTEKIIVIDNYQLLNEREIEYVNLMITQSAWRFVIISRAELPKALSIYVGLSVHLIGMDQLKFTEAEIMEYFERWNISLTDQEIAQLYSDQKGWIISYRYTASLMQAAGEPYTRNIQLKALESIYQYLDIELLGKLDRLEKKVILTVGCFDKITAEETDVLLESPDAHEVLEELTRQGCFLTFLLPDVYILHPFFKDYLTYTRNKVLSKDEIEKIYSAAGEYFEKKNESTMALEYYIKAKEYKSVIRLLIELSKSPVGQTDLWKNKKYYYELPEEMIKEEPALCCGMAMLGIICFNLEEADRWKGYLENQLKLLPEIDPKRAEVYEKLAFLSIAMPNSDMHDFLNIMKNWAKKVKYGNLQMQKANITWNTPSVVNGGRDFTPWLKKAKMVRNPMDWVVISLYGDYGIGVLDVAVAECYYQQDKIQESLVQVVRAISFIEQKGSIIILFAAMTVQMMIMMLLGQTVTTKPMLDNMRDKIEAANADFLYPNLEAVSAFVSLYENNYEKIDYWLNSEAPDENATFCTLDIFRYTVKLRVYILYEKYYLAIGLAEKLRSVCTAFHRNMDLAQLDTLLAIVYYRMGQKEKAEEYLTEAVIRGEKYGYIRIFADQGEPLYKILRNFEVERLVSKKYLNKVKEATKKVAMLYPSYLTLLNNKQEKLSASEMEVLNLMAQAKANNEIAEYLNISLNTVKFHIKNIYSKLGAKNRFQAVHMARDKGMLSNQRMS